MRDPPKYLEINSIMRFKYKLIAFKSSLSNCNEFKIESDQFDVTRTVHHIWRHNCIALCSLQKPVSYWDQMNVCCWPHTRWEFVIHFILSIATYFLLSFQQPRKCRSVKKKVEKFTTRVHSASFHTFSLSFPGVILPNMQFWVDAKIAKWIFRSSSVKLKIKTQKIIFLHWNCFFRNLH